MAKKQERTPEEQAAEVARLKAAGKTGDLEAGIVATGQMEKAKNRAQQATGDVNDPNSVMRSVQEVQVNKAQVTGELEEAGAFEEVTPTEVSLQPEPGFGENIPVLGPSTGAIGFAVGNLLPFLKGPNVQKPFDGPLEEGTIREAALREISEQEYKKGISSAEAFGTLVESIPVVGSLARQYAAGLIETPSSNADQVIAELVTIGTEATNNQEKTRSGIMPAPFAMARARDMEESIAELEGRLQLLILSSPILRANSDEVNKIQKAIFDAKIRTDNFRTAASFALTAELTGTGRIVPTDEQMYFALKDSK